MQKHCTIFLVVIFLEQNIERELKILVNKEIFDKLLKKYPFNQEIIQTNTYYDTSDNYIKSQKGAMRIRTIGDKKIFTLKIRKDEITHNEYEKEIHVNTIQDIKDDEIENWLHMYNIPKDVHKIVTFTTQRRTYDFENGQLCADITSYENHMDYEIEYEYTENHDGISFFNEILKPFGIHYEKNCPSKIARALNN